jgi:molybdopterin-binding protein
MPLSARNQIQGRVTEITKGEATANVEIDAGGQRLVASITVEAADERSWPRAPRSRRSSRPLT